MTPRPPRWSGPQRTVWRPRRSSTPIWSMSPSMRQGSRRLATTARGSRPKGRPRVATSASRPACTTSLRRDIDMYRYDEFDARFVRERVAQFSAQIARRLDGSLTKDEFKPLHLKNGVYLQLHAYMLRIAVPYGTLASRQLRQLAMIADKYDRGYGHFTTR